VYGLVGPAVSPPDVLRGRGRIFPAPARGTRTPSCIPLPPDSGEERRAVCPRDVPGPPLAANDRHHQQPVNLKPARAPGPRATHRNTRAPSRLSASACESRGGGGLRAGKIAKPERQNRLFGQGESLPRGRLRRGGAQALLCRRHPLRQSPPHPPVQPQCSYYVLWPGHRLAPGRSRRRWPPRRLGESSSRRARPGPVPKALGRRARPIPGNRHGAGPPPGRPCPPRPGRRPGRWMRCKVPGRTGCAGRSRSPRAQARMLMRWLAYP